MEKRFITQMSKEELEKFCLSIGETKYRASQIRNWVYFKNVSSFEMMTDLSKKFRQKICELVKISAYKIKQKQVSSDGTVKYLLEFQDGNCVETVLMRFDNRENLTACVSSQVGCQIGCKFCATAKRGFIRNLEPFEIVEQVLAIQQDLNIKVTNVVFMGQGEPLQNLDNVLEAINILNDEFQIGKRRITVSTCGVVDGISTLAKLNFQPTLAVSLHCANDEKRSQIMPINRKYPINVLISSLKDFVDKTKNRITIEYTLIGGNNDSLTDAKELSLLIKDLKCNVNLIIYNPVLGDKFKRPEKINIQKFKYILEQTGKKVTIRLERGADIDAACGQLSGKYCEKDNIL